MDSAFRTPVYFDDGDDDGDGGDGDDVCDDGANLKHSLRR